MFRHSLISNVCAGVLGKCFFWYDLSVAGEEEMGGVCTLFLEFGNSLSVSFSLSVKRWPIAFLQKQMGFLDYL